MRLNSVLLAAVVLAASPVLADPPELAFKPAGKGCYEFDTGVGKGTLRNQVLSSLIHLASGMEVVNSNGLGVFGYYRVFSSGTRYGERVYNRPAVSKLLRDGAVEVHWPAAEEHPLEITGIYRWSAPDTLDLETIVTLRRDMPRFEVFLASYVAKDFRGWVYVKPNDHGAGTPGFLSADVNPLVEGSYLMFPLHREAAPMIFDGRWEHPPSPVQWSVTRRLAAPMALRRHRPSGVTIVQMATPEDCFAVAMSYNKEPRDDVSNHFSMYLSLFGRDLKAGETARAHSRFVIGQNLGNRRAVELYNEFLKKRKSLAGHGTHRQPPSATGTH